MEIKPSLIYMVMVIGDTKNIVVTMIMGTVAITR